MNPYQDIKNRTIGFALEDKAKKNGDRTFLYYEDLEVSYNEINKNANRIANGFTELGIKKGENVCILLPNCPEYFYLWFGLSKIGAVEVPINVHYKGRLLEYILNNSEARVLVVDASYLAHVESVGGELKNIDRIVVFSKSSYGEEDLPAARTLLPRFRMTSFRELFEHSDDNPSVEVKYSDPFAVMYTSGTTGPSKGVILPHNYALAAFPEPMQKYLGVSSQDVFYNCWPMFHVTAQIEVAMVAFMADGRCALVDRFRASLFWDDARRYGCTRFSYMGPVISILMKQPERKNDKDNPMRVGFGVPTPKAIHQAFEDRFGVKLCEPYGSTDIGFATLNHLLDYRV
ncbi:MAG: AMP-binding protein, partial [Candidatus Aminicenantes bacterium]|nr:AMP-binding protein [Candidatus Aminicenantes bacterium]